MLKQMAFHVDTSACVNCRACQIVCKDKNNLPMGVTWRRVIQYEGGSWVARREGLVPDGVFTYSVSISCMHCAKPKCLEACPAGAIVKRSDGVVLIDPKKCVGSRLCEDACPYGAPQFSVEKGIMTKCDFCQDLLARGQNPACVDACSLRALRTSAASTRSTISDREGWVSINWEKSSQVTKLTSESLRTMADKV